jgi:hypothetical protein
MDARRIRTALPMLYALAIVVAAVVASGTVVAAVAVIGALLLGLAYSMLAGGRTSPNPERAARRARRRHR